ncbi:MAG: metal-dependent transcriptional regulator [Chloroflexi bacterium]|nr:metal-dependent transcriptional regulator [Chloroflexota bacterium]
MPDPLLTLMIAVALIGAIAFIFWPERGVFSRWQRGRRMTERVLREDALKHIHRAERAGHPATVQSVAGDLNITTNDAAELLSQMEALDLVVVDKEGLRLTPVGRDAALHIIRAHRLWERYLADQTGFTEAEWHGQAEYLEHRLQPTEIDALSASLGNPTHDPHGDPIPTAEGALYPHGGQPLTTFEAGTTSQIVHLEDEPEVVFAQLVAEGLYPGLEIQILEKEPHRLRFWADGDEHVLAPLLAANISVVAIEDQATETEPAPGERLYVLEKGERATVLSISKACRSAERRRLMDLGILPGVDVEAAFKSPSGDPTAYLIRDTLIALRKEQAGFINIERLQGVTL